MKKPAKFSRKYNRERTEGKRFRIRTGYPYGIFSKRSGAEVFATRLQAEMGMQVQIYQKPGAALSDAQVAAAWDLVPPYGKAFAVQLLYRLYEMGIAWRGYAEQPLQVRLDELKEYLRFMAIRDGRWHDLLATAQELTWYQAFSGLTDPQMRQGVIQSESKRFLIFMVVSKSGLSLMCSTSRHEVLWLPIRGFTAKEILPPCVHSNISPNCRWLG